MPQTPAHALRYPSPADTPDVPRDLGWLAADVEAALDAVPPGSLTAIPVVTTLPPSPIDGQQCVLVNATRTYAWLCQYDATAPAPYRWLVLHAAELLSKVDTSVSIPGNNVYAAAAGGPTLTLPRAGVWLVELGFDAMVPSGAGRMASSAPQWAAADDESAGFSGPSNTEVTLTIALPAKTLNTAATITAQYKSTAAGVNVTASKRWLQARPVRIS